MRRERIERDVGDHAQLGTGLLTARTARCARPSGFHASRPSSALGFAGRYRKQRERRNAQRHELFGLARPARRPTRARCPACGDRLAPAAALDDEHGLDQVVRGQGVFAHEAPRKFDRAACGACGFLGNSPVSRSDIREHRRLKVSKMSVISTNANGAMRARGPTKPYEA